jgi:hypothetical protein
MGTGHHEQQENQYGPTSMIKFGFKSTDVDAVARELAAHLEISFDLHYSDFRGGNYCRSEDRAGTVFVQPNRDLDDREPFEPDWPLNHVVVYLDGLDDRAWDDIANRIRMASSELGATELTSG